MVYLKKQGLRRYELSNKYKPIFSPKHSNHLHVQIEIITLQLLGNNRKTILAPKTYRDKIE